MEKTQIAENNEITLLKYILEFRIKFSFYNNFISLITFIIVIFYFVIYTLHFSLCNDYTLHCVNFVIILFYYQGEKYSMDLK